MSFVRNVSYGSSLMLLTACATYTDWKPTIDPHNDPHANRIERDLYECKQLSISASGDGAECNPPKIRTHSNRVISS